jgi:secreted trypsin-like serine protease
VNGYTSVAHSWPWTVILYDNGAQRCDGFLVTYEHVITAAHCVLGLTTATLQIYIGVQSRSAILDRQVQQVSNIQIHPNYSTKTYLNDIAILKLAAKVTTTTTVGICCLPSDPSLPMENEAAVIVGWGRTRADDSSSVSDTLQQAVVQIQTCDPNFYFDRQFCAGYSTSDACQGDSGGPLMTNVNNLWTCTGIVSYGGKCGYGGYYTRVAYYRSFIDNAILTM